MPDIHNAQTITPFIKSPHIGSTGVDVVSGAGGSGGSGTPGAVWYSGTSSPPSGGTGIVGDFFLNTSNGEVYEKTAATVWTYRMNIQGAAGAGVPPGGSVGQVLAKSSSVNYSTQWVDQTAGGTVVSGAYVPLDQFPVTFGVQVSSNSVAVSASTTIPTVSVRAPYAFTLTEVRAFASAADGVTVLLDIESTIGGISQSILGNRIQIDANELTSIEAATQPTIVQSNVASDQELRFFVDQVGAGWRGLTVWLLGRRTITLTPTVPGTPSWFGPSLGAVTGQATVFWSPPSENNSPILSYDVQYKLASGSTWTTYSGGIGSGTVAGTGLPYRSAILTGLTTGSLYDVRVRAVNAVGPGPWGVSQLTPTAGVSYSVPSAPTITSVTAGSALLTVTFTAPASDGGSAVTSYQYSTDNGTTWTTRSGTATSTAPFDITGLTNGTAYTVKLRAVNAVGASTASAGVAGTPTAATAPSAPTITAVASGAAQLTVTFTAPVSDGGAAISNYQYSTDNGTTWTTRSLASTASPLVITGLTNGTAYTVKLRAVNSVGSGTASAGVAGTPTAGGSWIRTPTGNTWRVQSTADQVNNPSASAASLYGWARTPNGTNSSVTPLGATSYLYVGQYTEFLDPEYRFGIEQGFVEFDTAVGGTVTSCSLTTGISFDYSDNDFTLEVYARDYGTTVDATDFVPGATLTGLTLAASLSTVGLTTSGTKTFTLSGTVLQSAISTSGKTRLLFVASRNRTGTAPGGGSLAVVNELLILPTTTITLSFVTS